MLKKISVGVILCNAQETDCMRKKSHRQRSFVFTDGTVLEMSGISKPQPEVVRCCHRSGRHVTKVRSGRRFVLCAEAAMDTMKSFAIEHPHNGGVSCFASDEALMC